MENNQMIPVAQKFQILEKEVDVPENLNIFNEYRLTYRELAKKVTTELVEEYKANIKNLDDFLGKFPELYKNKLEILTKKAVDTLVSEGVWTITYDSFLETHINDFHLAMDDYKVMVDNFNAKIEENQRKKEKMWGYVPTLMGGGFGISGVLKGIATATAYNLIRDGIEENSLKKANVKPEQRIEIYKLLNTSILFDRVFADYWNVFLSLVKNSVLHFSNSSCFISFLVPCKFKYLLRKMLTSFLFEKSSLNILSWYLFISNWP